MYSLLCYSDFGTSESSGPFPFFASFPTSSFVACQQHWLAFIPCMTSWGSPQSLTSP